MKLLSATSLILLIIGFNIEQAMAQENNIIKLPSADTLGLAILFLVSIAILVVLTMRLSKNIEKLDETANANKKDGRQWLDGNLKDMDTRQLEILIKRSHSVK